MKGTSWAIVGRPNVGKSSLFNRLIGQRKSLVYDREGVTRDRLKGLWKDTGAEVWDMAGFDEEVEWPEEFLQQVKGVLLVVDASENLLAKDIDCIERVRKLKKPWLIVANKSDKKSFLTHQAELFKYAKPEQIVAVSCERGFGIEDLEEECQKLLPAEENSVSKDFRRILILGRPNVGKSSLLNAVTGKNLSVVSDKPGTTRDAVEGEKKVGGITYLFLDTAGIRKKSKIDDVLEVFSIQKSLNELRRADSVCLLLEGNMKGTIHHQERQLLEAVDKAMKPTIVMVNKWDTVRERWSEKSYRSSLEAYFPELKHFPILFVSAKTRFHLDKMIPLLASVDQRVKLFKTTQLNQWLQSVKKERTPRIAKKGIRGTKHHQNQFLNYYYMVQSSERPMTFQIFCNAPQWIPRDEKRFWENRLRSEFKLDGIPFHLVFRRKK